MTSTSLSKCISNCPHHRQIDHFLFRHTLLVFQNLCFLAHLPSPQLPIPVVTNPNLKSNFKITFSMKIFQIFPIRSDHVYLTPWSMFTLSIHFITFSLLPYELYCFSSPFSDHKILQNTDCLHHLPLYYSTITLFIKVWSWDQQCWPPGSSSEMQKVGSHLRPTESGCSLTRSPGDAYVLIKLI